MFVPIMAQTKNWSNKISEKVCQRLLIETVNRCLEGGISRGLLLLVITASGDNESRQYKNMLNLDNANFDDGLSLWEASPTLAASIEISPKIASVHSIRWCSSLKRQCP